MVRYSRNINVEGFSCEMQETLMRSSVLVVGAGGLGSAVINYLAMAGIGKIGVVEFDTVSESNLQRQILFCEKNIGQNKGEIAIATIQSKNSKCQAVYHNTKFTQYNGLELASGYDIIVDCSDNYEARMAMDLVSKKLKIPFVYGSAEQLGGQISTFNYRGAGSYSDLFPELPASKDREILGVLSPIPGIVGSIQALEVIKILTDMSNNLSGKLMVIDGLGYGIEVFEW